jgi:hypothetical protein
MHWTREAIATRVEGLAREHRGPELVAAIQAFADGLGEGERQLLAEVLLERAGREPSVERAFAEGVRPRGWLRRQWDAADERSRRHRSG